MPKALLICDLGWKLIHSKLLTYGTNIGMSDSLESETQVPSAYRIELYIH